MRDHVKLRLRHQLLLQSIMSRPVLLARDLEELHKEIFQRRELQDEDDDKENERRAALELPEDREESFEMSLERINEALRLSQLEVRQVKFELDWQTYFALVNTVEDEVAKIGSRLAPWALEIFKEVVTKVLDSASGDIDTISIQNLRGNRHMEEIEALIEELLSGMWLWRCGSESNPRYALGPRAFAELLPVLRSQNVPLCKVCQVETVKSVRCPGDCDVRMHLQCARRWFANRAQKTCMECSSSWQIVLEQAAEAQI